MQTPTAILAAELNRRGYIVPADTIAAALTAASLTLTGGARQAAEAHLAEHARLGQRIMEGNV